MRLNHFESALMNRSAKMISLTTERLIIRNFTIHDWQSLYQMIIQYQSTEYADYDQQWPTTPEEIKGVAEWFASGDNFVAVYLRETNQFIGFVALNPEEDEAARVFNFGYIFHSDYHGKGYASESCRAILNYAFDRLQAEKIISGTAALNRSSCRLLERLGFQKTGENASSFKTTADGKPIEFLGCIYAITNAEWESLKTQNQGIVDERY
jgi:RimJ/RimL family protein N-acetyltransferase